MIHEEIYEPRISDYNKNGMLSLEAILEIAENAGSHHATKANDDIIEGSQKGIAWVLAEWVVKIERRPHSGEKLHISTWTRNPSLSATTVVRDIVMQDADKNYLIRLCPTFVLFDLATHRLLRISTELLKNYKPEDNECMALDNTRLREPATFETEKTLHLRRTDMDFNGHLHNARYISLALEALPQQIYDADRFKGLRIVYRVPLNYDDTVIVRCHAEEDKAVVCFSKQDGTLCTIVEYHL